MAEKRQPRRSKLPSARKKKKSLQSDISQWLGGREKANTRSKKSGPAAVNVLPVSSDEERDPVSQPLYIISLQYNHVCASDAAQIMSEGRNGWTRSREHNVVHYTVFFKGVLHTEAVVL